MRHSAPVRTTIHLSRGRIRMRRLRAAGLLVIIATSAAVLGPQLLASSSSTAAETIEAVRGEHREPRGEDLGALGEPDVANLDADLLGALRDAAADAARDGVAFSIHSGWRSPEYQEQLFQEAIAQYGSEEEVARWVATPETSAHVSGDAVDIGPDEAAAWLSEHGAEYGLCQIYGNEPWHYELRSEAAEEGCPEMYADPTDDPRMQP